MEFHFHSPRAHLFLHCRLTSVGLVLFHSPRAHLCPIVEPLGTRSFRDKIDNGDNIAVIIV